MNILCIKTDSARASIHLVKDEQVIAEETWDSGRQLAGTLLKYIDATLEGRSFHITDLDGVIVFRGPGSFTGLRIGVSVANTLAYSLNIPIVGASGVQWMQKGIEELQTGINERIIVPEYGGEAHITM